MRPTRAEQLAKAKEALIKGRDLTKLMVCPGPRGVDTVRNGLRSTGRHLYWYRRVPAPAWYYRTSGLRRGSDFPYKT